MKYPWLNLFFFISVTLWSQNVQNPDLSFLGQGRSGRWESGELRAESPSWGAWVKARDDSSLGGLRVGPVMAGPLLLTSPGPQKWGWAWNKRAAAGSLGLVVGWNTPVSLWINQNSQTDECGVQIQGGWEGWKAAGSFRRRVTAAKVPRAEGPWVDQAKGGGSFQSKNFRWEGGGSLYLPQRGGRGLEGSSSLVVKAFDQEWTARGAAAGGATLEDKEPWKVSLSWELPLFYGRFLASAASSHTRTWDSASLRWARVTPDWDFYHKIEYEPVTGGTQPQCWSQELGAEVKMKTMVWGVVQGWGQEKEVWNLHTGLKAEVRNVFIPGRLESLLDARWSLEEETLATYQLTLGWTAPGDRARFSLGWKRCPRPWLEVPQAQLTGPYTQTDLALELHW